MATDGPKQLRCPSCNSIDLVEEGRFYVCQYCGGKLEKSQGTVQATVSSDGSVQKLIERADLYWDLGKTDKARQLYRQVLDIDANNVRAKSRV